MDSLPPRIVCAAMLMQNGDIIIGIRHFSPDMRSVMHKCYGEGYHLKVREQGFIDQYGNFHSREIAWKIAQNNNQIIRECGVFGVLFSENLY